MTRMRLVGALSFVVASSVFVAGTAAADSVSVGLTGPDSTQKVTLDSRSTTVTSNNSDVKVVNTSEQQATTGSILASNDTTVGGLGSGSATNHATAATTVTISNASTSPSPIVTTGGQGGVSVPSGGNGAVSPVAPAPTGGKGSAVATSTGSVLGAQTGGVGAAILPVTGPLVPVDVSALRNAWRQPVSTVTAVNAPKADRAVSAAMLFTAAALGLLGAWLSVIQARRKQHQPAKA